jgi:hypothetical protein
VRGPNKDSCNLIGSQNIRCAGTLTLALSRECAGEGNTPLREKIGSPVRGNDGAERNASLQFANLHKLSRIIGSFPLQLAGCTFNPPPGSIINAFQISPCMPRRRCTRTEIMAYIVPKSQLAPDRLRKELP